MIRLKSREELLRMREAGRIVARVFAALAPLVEPGVTTAELDAVAEQVIRQAGARPSFLGYGQPPFPAATCISIDEEVVHGIPSERKLQEGQLVSIDVGCELKGYHGDAARTYAVGRIDEDRQRLVQVTEESFWRGFAAAEVGRRIGDVSQAVQAWCEERGFGVVTELTGHGIGRNLHEAPDLPNFGRAGRGLRLAAGMTLALEPMITLGSHRVKRLDDGWTYVTEDGRPSAHYENSFAVTADGPKILTALDDEWPEHSLTA